MTLHVRPLLMCAAVLLAYARHAGAQTDTTSLSVNAPRWIGQFTTLSANAAIGALTAGVIQKARGGSFRDGFTRGALGGAIIFAGKRVVAERFTGAGLLGREIAAVGASAVRNASDGIGTLDRIIAPVAFTRIYWNRKEHTATAKLDLVSLGYTIYGITENELHFDARESFSAGAPVFRTENKVISVQLDQHAAGVQYGGVIFRSDVPGWGKELLSRALAHERVHILQDDQIFATLNDHADDWLLARWRVTAPVGRYVDLNGSSELLRQLGRLFPKHADRPWELEAIFLAR